MLFRVRDPKAPSRAGRSSHAVPKLLGRHARPKKAAGRFVDLRVVPGVDLISDSPVFTACVSTGVVVTDVGVGRPGLPPHRVLRDPTRRQRPQMRTLLGLPRCRPAAPAGTAPSTAVRRCASARTSAPPGCRDEAPPAPPPAGAAPSVHAASCRPDTSASQRHPDFLTPQCRLVTPETGVTEKVPRLPVTPETRVTEESSCGSVTPETGVTENSDTPEQGYRVAHLPVDPVGGRGPKRPAQSKLRECCHVVEATW